MRTSTTDTNAPALIGGCHAFPPLMITEGLSQLFCRGRGIWARGTSSLTALADPRHV
jgi:hypothetical protein